MMPPVNKVKSREDMTTSGQCLNSDEKLGEKECIGQLSNEQGIQKTNAL
jgi:hypothetical protein